MSAVTWVTLLMVTASILFVAGVVGAVLICVELALDGQTASPHSQRTTRHRASSPGKTLVIVAVCALPAAAPLAVADPAPEAHQACAASTQEQARWLGEVLFEQGAYQRAGECYEAAGEHDLANRAFLKAVAPASAATARQLSDQREQANALLRKVQQAFRDH